MTTVPLPEESESQRIGHNAGKSFAANCPNSWRVHSLEGTDDAGFDYQIQVVEGGRYRDIFRVQLKGTESPELNATRDFFSIALKGRTLNYYARVTEPILLVLCDLSVDPSRPIACPLYYIWIHDEIRRHRENNANSEQQTSLTIRVPTLNILTSTTDLSAEIESHRRMYAAVKALDQTVEAKLPSLGPEGRADVLERISGGFAQRSSALIEEMSAPVTTPWPEAPRNSVAGKLNDVAQKLSAGLTKTAAAKLADIFTTLDEATTFEQAEYWYLKGRQLSQDLDETAATDAYRRAYDLSSITSKYRVAWVEAELRLRFEEVGDTDFSDLKGHLTTATSEEVVLHARLLAAEGRYEDATNALNTISRKETLSCRAIIATMQSNWLDVISLCTEGLEGLEIKDETKQLFYLLRARANFYLAILGTSRPETGIVLPVFGPADLNPEYLNAAWNDIEKTIELMSIAGWPSNVEYLSDIWAGACLMLGREKETLNTIQAAATCRPAATGLQNALERVAMQCDEWNIALNANEKQPASPERTFRRIILLYRAQRYPACVELIVNELDSLPRDDGMFPICASIGILAADEVVRPEVSSRLELELRGRPEWKDHLAVLHYYRTVSQNALAKDAAVVELEAAYHASNKSKTIGLQLFHAFDSFDVMQAQKCVDLSIDLRAEQQFSIDAELHLAQAYTTLGKWDLLLNLVNNAIARYAHVSRFQAVRAFALDKLGETAKALEQLQVIIEDSVYDSVAVNTYINIATRCGFSEDAISLVEKLLSQETIHTRKLDYLRLLFGLVHSNDPQSQRAEEIAWRIGLHTKREVEDEEGVFILTYLTATLASSVVVTEARRTELQARIKAFSQRFPDSKIFRVGLVPESPNADELLKVLRELVGDNTEREAFQRKLTLQLERGEISIPFAWRPQNVLGNVSDIAALWEIAKRSKRDARQYHLSMALGEWKAVPEDQIRGKIPLLDLTALLVIKDLGLFETVFKIFPKIAISQSTLLELQHLVMPMAGTWARAQCQELIDLLKPSLEKIVQPLAPSSADGGRGSKRSLGDDEVKALTETGAYLLYSDDALYRLYVTSPSSVPSICTLDILCMADQLGLLSPKRVAQMLGQLCAWNVGIVVPERYLLAVIPDEVGSAKTVQEAMDVIRANEISNALFEGIWNVRKSYKDIQGHVVVLLANLLGNVQNDVKVTSAIVGIWFGKARLRTDVGNMPTLRRLSLLIVGGLLHLSKADQSYARRALQVYMDIVSIEYGSRMDEAKEREAIQELGAVVAELEHQMKERDSGPIEKLVSVAFTVGTADRDRFTSAYANRLFELKSKGGT
jgi:tetratricopeptide (TPR) repeat protein